jgi:hypothetical protein
MTGIPALERDMCRFEQVLLAGGGRIVVVPTAPNPRRRLLVMGCEDQFIIPPRLFEGSGLMAQNTSGGFLPFRLRAQ